MKDLKDFVVDNFAAFVEYLEQLGFSPEDAEDEAEKQISELEEIVDEQ